jgi:hypothetical protein
MFPRQTRSHQNFKSIKMRPTIRLSSCLALLGLLLIAGCSPVAGSGSQNDKNSGFYGGVLGGGSRP